LKNYSDEEKNIFIFETRRQFTKLFVAVQLQINYTHYSSDAAVWLFNEC